MTRPYRFLAFVIVCAAPIAIAACGDETDTGSSAAATSGAGAATSASSGGPGGGTTSGGGMGGEGTTSGGGQGGDTGAGGGTGGTGGGSGGAGGGNGNQAQAFCMTYEQTCGFGGTHYGSLNECVAAFNSFTPKKQQCVIDHVGYADSMTSEHCVHATGMGPCAI